MLPGLIVKLVSEWPFSMAGSVLQKGGACKSPFEGGVGIRLGTFWEKVSQTNRPAGKTLPASHASFPDPDFHLCSDLVFGLTFCWLGS